MDWLDSVFVDEMEKKIVLDKYVDLITNCKNCVTSQDKLLIQKAFELSVKTHKGQYIRKGYPYILHPIEVARIASDEIGLGVNSIVASFLHEVLDAGNITVKQIKLEFGEIVAIIVEGLSKISSINSNTNVLHAENFRKFLLTMANDIRVILVKIADRLHNMRNLKYKNANRQLKMALETSYLYAPLAHRLGLYTIKSELEDLALKYLDSETYQYIDKNLKNTKQKREKYIKSFIAPINNRLKEEGLKFEIKGRTKSITSIWNKIKKQNVDFESIYDIYAIRIIIDAPLPKEKELCWKVYSVVTDIYQPNPQRLRDWLSVPKSNGYESLHITVLGSDGKWVEVQIRTIRMDEIAEKGFAAHYMYKGIQGSGSEVEDWLSKMRELLETPGENLSEFVDNVQLNLYSDEIFVFTPKGDIKKLPVNSTVLDFAYDIHTEIGNRCAGAKINNKNAGIKQILENGDQVEIITSKNQKPKSDWLGFVITSKAKSKIKASLNEEKLKEAQLGKEILKRRLKNWKIEFTDEVVRKLLKHYKLINATDFYSQLSDKTINIIEVKDVLANDEETLVEKKAEIIEDVKVDQFSDDYKILSTDILIIENKIKGIDYKFAKCCNPIFGDKIFGFVTINEGIKIHRYNCPNAPQLLARYPYRVVRAKWTKTEGVKVFQSVIKINGINNAGLLSHISDLISKDPNVTIRNISVSNNDGLFEGILTILVQDKHHLDAILMKLLKIKGVTRALRLNQ